MPKSISINLDELAAIVAGDKYAAKRLMVIFGYKTAAGIYNAVKSGLFPKPAESVGEGRQKHYWTGEQVIAEANRRLQNGQC